MCIVSGKKKKSSSVATTLPVVQQQTPPAAKVEIQVPTQADAEVTKAHTAAKNTAAGSATKNIKTTARGLLDDANTKKKGLLGA